MLPRLDAGGQPGDSVAPPTRGHDAGTAARGCAATATPTRPSSHGPIGFKVRWDSYCDDPRRQPSLLCCRGTLGVQRDDLLRADGDPLGGGGGRPASTLTAEAPGRRTRRHTPPSAAPSTPRPPARAACPSADGSQVPAVAIVSAGTCGRSRCPRRPRPRSAARAPSAPRRCRRFGPAPGRRATASAPARCPPALRASAPRS